MKMSLTLVTLLLFFPVIAQAHPPVRCNGKIQFRPCRSQSRVVTMTESPKKQIRASLKQTAKNRPVEVIEPHFRKIDRKRGEWKGMLKGRGLIHLSLQLFQANGLISERYMGNVRLNPTRDERISFQFTSTIPQQVTQWSWKVEAYT